MTFQNDNRILTHPEQNGRNSPWKATLSLDNGQSPDWQTVPGFDANEAPANAAFILVNRKSADGDMDTQAERDRTDAKIDLAEARTDTKIVRLEAKLDAVLEEAKEARREARETRSDAKTTRTVVVTTTLATGLGVAGLVFALASYGASQFYNGTVLRDLIHQVVQQPGPAK